MKVLQAAVGMLQGEARALFRFLEVGHCSSADLESPCKTFRNLGQEEASNRDAIKWKNKTGQVLQKGGGWKSMGSQSVTSNI